MDIQIFSLRLGLALLLGAFIGIERQWRQKSAGLRTNTLVSLGAAAYILLSHSLVSETGDPARMASQIVAGIGFLGAGVIMKDGLNIQGLSTAATIWCSAAVGALAGSGLTIEALITCGAVVLVHLFLIPVDKILSKNSKIHKEEGSFEYLLTIKCKQEGVKQIRESLVEEFSKNDQILLRGLSTEEFLDNNTTVSLLSAELTTNGNHHDLLEKLIGKYTRENIVHKAAWKVMNHHF